MPLVVFHPIGGIHLGHDPIFSAAADVPGATMNRAGAVLDDAAAGVAALVVATASQGADVRADSLYHLTAVASVFGAQAHRVLVGRPFTTHELYPAIHSVLRVNNSVSTSASAVRDSLVTSLTGGVAPGGGSAGAGQTSFYVAGGAKTLGNRGRGGRVEMVRGRHQGRAPAHRRLQQRQRLGPVLRQRREPRYQHGLGPRRRL